MTPASSLLDLTRPSCCLQVAVEQRPFAHTGHTLRLMQRVAAALAHREPTLLVGETGTGKTTLVAQIADKV